MTRGEKRRRLAEIRAEVEREYQEWKATGVGVRDWIRLVVRVLELDCLSARVRMTRSKELVPLSSTKIKPETP